MNFFISHPVKELQSVITVPGDKSISHRSIILGSIAKGITTVDGFLEGKDCQATLKAFQSMGVQIERRSSSSLTIKGVGKYGLKKPDQIIDCGNSGTSMRLMAGLLAAQSFDSCLTGDESLRKRPMARISEPLGSMGAVIETVDGCPPLSIKGGQALSGIVYPMPVASAQVKSCLLLAGLYAKGKTRVIEPAPSRDHTERMFKAFGCPLNIQDNSIEISSEYECRATHITVPGDISSAAFFIVAATLIPDASLEIQNVGINPGRTGILQILERMGASFSIQNLRMYQEEPVADLFIQHAVLHGIEIPKEYIPLAIDEFPVLFIAAALAKGQTILHGASELRTKESDRIAAMVSGLQTLGVRAEALEDGVVIEGGAIHGGNVDSCHDHRIAMAFAIAGAAASQPVIIQNTDNVATSFPGFIETARTAGLCIEEFKHEVG